MSALRTHFTFRVDTWRRRKHRGACRRRRGLPGCARNVPSCLRTLARHSHHIAAGGASDRGQPAPARGVESIKSTTFREEPLGTPVSLRSGALVISLWPNEGSRDPAHLTVLGRGSRLADD